MESVKSRAAAGVKEFAGKTLGHMHRYVICYFALLMLSSVHGFVSICYRL